MCTSIYILILIHTYYISYYYSSLIVQHRYNIFHSLNFTRLFLLFRFAPRFSLPFVLQPPSALTTKLYCDTRETKTHFCIATHLPLRLRTCTISVGSARSGIIAAFKRKCVVEVAATTFQNRATPSSFQVFGIHNNSMLQNPSKYHPNPFSHLLALHSSQAVANSNISTHQAHLAALPPVFATQSQLQLQHQQQQLQQQQQQHYNNIHSTMTGTNQQHNNAFLLQNHPPREQQQQQHTNYPLLNPTQRRTQELLDTTNTSLDMGKSFTIAAILGLQKSAMENSCKDYNNAINLSLNSNDDDVGKESSVGRSAQSTQSKHFSDEEVDNSEQQSQQLQATNDANNATKSLKCERITNNMFHRNAGHFDCNGNAGAALIHRYLPIPVSSKQTTAATSSFVAAAAAATQHQHQHQQQQQQQNILLSHVRSVASAAAAASGGTSSALQSLQQLHQHHAQQSSLNLQREKHKSGK